MFKMLLARVREARAGELEGESGLEAGFTLIELMVVLLIIAILLAIAIPTFLGVSGGARDRSAQSNATNALTDLIAYYQNGQTYLPSASLATTMNTDEPAFSWVNGTTACGTTANPLNKCISVAPYDVATSGDGQAVILAVMSGNGNNCWFVANLQQTGATVVSEGTSGYNSFVQSATSGAAGYQAYSNGGTAAALTGAGTYYAEYPNDSTTGTSNCEANQAETKTTGWTWYSSYSQAQSNPY